MSWLRTLQESVKDLVKIGPAFALAGLRNRLGTDESRVEVLGRRFIVRGRNSDFATLRQTVRNREYAIRVPAFAAQLEARCSEIITAGEHPVIVDAGANIGAAALWFAHAYPKATLVAVEPDTANADLLRRNLAAIGPHHIVLEAAIGAQAGFVSTQGSNGAGWAIRTTRAEQGVPVLTIADAVAQVPQGRLFIAKIDIEGFEDDLFSANTAWIDDAEAVFVEPHDWMLPERRTSRTFQAAFGSRRFAMLLIGENLLYIRDRDPPALVPRSEFGVD